MCYLLFEFLQVCSICWHACAGYKLKLIMPANMSEERRAAMAAYGAELISVPAGKMELARDLAHELQVMVQYHAGRLHLH